MINQVASFFSKTSILRWNLYMLHLLVFMLSFDERWIPGLVVLTLFLNLVSVSWKDRLYYFSKRKSFIIAFISFYLVTILGLFYTADLVHGLFDLEVKLTILLIPLVFLSCNVINKYTVFGLLKSFIWGVTASLAMQFAVAFFNFGETGKTDVFFYGLLSFFHHPSYFSMYVNFAVASQLVLIFHFRDRIKWEHYLLLVFLVIGIYQLSSRSGLLTLVLLLLYAFVYIIFPRLRWRKMLYALFATVLLSLAIIYPLSKFSNSFRKVEVTNTQSSSGVRLSMWKSAYPVIKENFLFGVGTGDVNRVLQQQFAKDKLIRAVRDNLNAHNQFIQTQVALGLMGTIALLVALFLPLWVSIKRGKLFYPLFALILLVNFLTESILNTQAGVVYYALMNTIVFFTYED